jgi:hypothetical protein
VVATGVTPTLGYGYYSPKYYTQTSANGSRRRLRPGGLGRPAGRSTGPGTGEQP